MEALYFGTSGGWGHGQGKGPWVMADLENGLWASDQKATAAPSLSSQYVTVMGWVRGFIDQREGSFRGYQSGHHTGLVAHSS